MNARQLKMLAAVAESGGYLSAGERLHISHSAVHRQVRLLEEAIGAKTLVRSGRTVRLTEVGELLVTLSHRIDADIAAVRAQLEDMRTLKEGLIRVGMGTTTLVFFLPPVLNELRTVHPGLEVQITTGTAEQLMRGVEKRDLDIVLISEPPPDWDYSRALRFRKLYSEEFVIVVSPQHPLARRKHISWAEAADLPILAFPKGSRIRQLIDHLFIAAGIEPRIKMELENDEAIVEMTKRDFGVGIVARSRASNDRLNILRIRGTKITLNIVAAFDGTYLPKRVERFLEICQTHAKAREAAAAS